MILSISLYFQDYIIIILRIDDKYNRNIYVNKLIPDLNKQCAEMISLIDRNIMNYNNVLVKIEDKKQRMILRDCLKDRFKVALYKSDDKEVKLTEDGLFDTNADVVISTSSIQNGQSINENILSIYVKTYIDTLSNVKQFLD